MLFNSFLFILVFLPVSYTLFLLSRRFHSVNLTLAVVILCSLAFYCYWNWRYGFLILASSAFNYGVVLLMSRLPSRRMLLIIGITVNLAVLAYFKYMDFLIQQLNTVAGLDIAPLKIVLPIAISFFTFQQIAYLVDAYRGEATRISYLRYLFILVFFPHLLAGPIVRFRELAPQIDAVLRRPSPWQDLAVGITLFSIGLFKKVCLADSFAEVANAGYAAAVKGTPLGFVDAWSTALAYTFQLYFDFSGYSDMALGLARMFGFRFSINFFSPYKATSIADFWRRWHITLSRFLRDYLYIALGGNRFGLLQRYRNLVITMALGGIWHGANWTFFVWGLGHGLLLVIETEIKRVIRRIGLETLAASRPARMLAVLITFLCVVILWVPFRAPDFRTAWHVLSAMASPGLLFISPIAYGWSYAAIAALLATGFAICWGLPNAYEFMHRFRPGLIRFTTGLARTPYWKRVQWSPNIGLAILAALLILASFYRMGTSVSEFLYFQF